MTGAVEKDLKEGDKFDVYELPRGAHCLTGCWASLSELRTQQVWGGAWEPAGLTSSQARLILLVWEHTWRIAGMGVMGNGAGDGGAPLRRCAFVKSE